LINGEVRSVRRNTLHGKIRPQHLGSPFGVFFSKPAAIKRYAEIKWLHPKAAKKRVISPFFRPKSEIEIHQNMIKDFTPEAASRSAGVWQLEFWLPSTEKTAAEFETKMSKEDPNGWGRTSWPRKTNYASHPLRRSKQEKNDNESEVPGLQSIRCREFLL